MKRTIFTLASARSGTLFLRDLFRLNAVNCVCRHEPFFDWGNPTMFGPAIYDAYAGRLDRLRARLAKKRDYLERLPGAVYLESSHAFLKSAYLAALEVFPGLLLVHLIRDPLQVAKSEAYRHQWRQRLRAPFHFYRGDDGRRHFYWSLTGNEEIFGNFARTPLTLFQWYLVQWIEIENRAMDFLDRHQLHGRCFTMQSPADLNVPEKVRALFDFLGLPTRLPHILMGRPRNKSLGPRTIVTPEDERQGEAVLGQLPAHYLEIFQREPYRQFHWSRRFRERLPLEARAAR
jgi:hypothetical protein